MRSPGLLCVADENVVLTVNWRGKGCCKRIRGGMFAGAE